VHGCTGVLQASSAVEVPRAMAAWPCARVTKLPDLRAMGGCAPAMIHGVRRSDLDLNGHVNNVVYTEWLMEAGPAPRARRTPRDAPPLPPPPLPPSPLTPTASCRSRGCGCVLEEPLDLSQLATSSLALLPLLIPHPTRSSRAFVRETARFSSQLATWKLPHLDPVDPVDPVDPGR